MNDKPMFSNKNIVKYSIKYFVVLTLTSYGWSEASSLASQKSDVANLMGTALFAGLFIGLLLILKSDGTKLVNVFTENKNKENE
jgi:hypothetical protein